MTKEYLTAISVIILKHIISGNQEKKMIQVNDYVLVSRCKKVLNGYALVSEDVIN